MLNSDHKLESEHISARVVLLDGSTDAVRCYREWYGRLWRYFLSLGYGADAATNHTHRYLAKRGIVLPAPLAPPESSMQNQAPPPLARVDVRI